MAEVRPHPRRGDQRDPRVPHACPGQVPALLRQLRSVLPPSRQLWAGGAGVRKVPAQEGILLMTGLDDAGVAVADPPVHVWLAAPRAEAVHAAAGDDVDGVAVDGAVRVTGPRAP